MVTVDFTGSSGQNEVVIVGPNTEGAVVKSGDINGQSISVDQMGTHDYEVVVNNLIDATPSFDITVVKGQACIGTSCVLDTEGSVLFDFTQVPTETGLRDIDADVDVFALKLVPEDAASYTLSVVDDVEALVCAESSAGHIEACDVRGVSGPQVKVVRNSDPPGSSKRARAHGGVELVQASTTLVAGDLETSESIDGFGDRAYFTLPIPDLGGATVDVGLGWKDRSIGKAEVCLYDDSPTNLPLPSGLLGCATFDDEHGGIEAFQVADNSDYLAVVDGVEDETGTFSLCLGAGEAVPAGSISIVDAQFSGPIEGELGCGGTAEWDIENDRLDGGTPIACEVEITVKETGARTGDVTLTDVGSSVSNTGTNSASLTIDFAASETRTISIDNETFGSPDYEITIDAVEGECGN